MILRFPSHWSVDQVIIMKTIVGLIIGIFFGLMVAMIRLIKNKLKNKYNLKIPEEQNKMNNKESDKRLEILSLNTNTIQKILILFGCGSFFLWLLMPIAVSDRNIQDLWYLDYWFDNEKQVYSAVISICSFIGAWLFRD